MVKKVVIQGYPGSFHDEAAKRYFSNGLVDMVPADNFELLASLLSDNPDIFYGVMAIENSIAGTLLQNYRILRENRFSIVGEIYLRIKHNLLGIKGAKKEYITKISSHPMAINQCLTFLKTMPNAKWESTADTALSAKHLQISQSPNEACIASTTAAQIYGLDVLEEGIETDNDNYTRFFILTKKKSDQIEEANKASLIVEIPDKKGQLLKILQCIQDMDMNMSKLQSYPVLGNFRSYYFHIDIEFEEIVSYELLLSALDKISIKHRTLGVYKRSDISQVLNIKKEK